jgi:ATP-binding cassette subfamily B protein
MLGRLFDGRSAFSATLRVECDVSRRFCDFTRGYMALLIPHRFSTVRIADRIFALETGRLTEDESRKELLEIGRRHV